MQRNFHYAILYHVMLDHTFYPPLLLYD